MAWTLRFWSSAPPPPATPVTWTYSPSYLPSDVSGAHVSAITSYINIIASQSSIASSRLNSYGQDIRFGYRAGDVGRAVYGGAVDDYVLIDISAAASLYFFNAKGKLVAGDVGLTIMHELAHIYLNASDPSHTASESTMNGANYDFRGPVINEQNSIASNAGLSDQIQTSYYAAVLSTQPLFNSFQANHSYSFDRDIETTRLRASGADNIDHSNNTTRTKDLIFGLGGNDTIKGGPGDDFIYGGTGQLTATGSGNDKIYGGAGGDYLFGGDGNDFLVSGTDIVSDDDEFGDKLDGGAGDDVLILDGRWIEEAIGGAGNDVFWIAGTANGSYWIVDSDPGDKLYWKGYRLTGGVKQVIEFVWDGDPSWDSYTSVGAVDSNGIRYYFVDGQLSISFPDGSGAMIQDFVNGDFGINVGPPIQATDSFLRWNEEEQKVEHVTSLPLSSITRDGQDSNYHDLPGFAAALAASGPEPIPTTFVAP